MLEKMIHTVLNKALKTGDVIYVINFEDKIMKIKNIILIMLVASTTSVMANQSNQRIDFGKITTKQLTDLNEKCLNNDYKGDDCQQLKQYQKEQKEKGQKATEQLIKHSH